MEEFVEVGKVNLETLMRVSAQGDGLYLYIPKQIVDVKGIQAGDRIEVKLGIIHRLKKLVREVRGPQKVKD